MTVDIATGNMYTAPAITSSVNSVINVTAPPYNAVGDNGVTDNTTPISNACTTAKTFSPPSQIYFPKASGYYLTGPLDACAGVPIAGQPGMALSVSIFLSGRRSNSPWKAGARRSSSLSRP